MSREHIQMFTAFPRTKLRVKELQSYKQTCTLQELTTALDSKALPHFMRRGGYKVIMTLSLEFTVTLKI